ncbi:MAG: 16S rRNA (uracil(1498)-N(3))-methyltransferase [Rhizobacter sp.]|nr:16S rRNA (uracil(1498)-N(3))-methyltransferase [Rhizobacter sp.]
MLPRFFVDQALRSDESLSLPAGPARHVQVLRLQPGAEITLFDSHGGEWGATVTRMGRSEVVVQVCTCEAVDRELALPVLIALGMPANERMDTVVEKATELGACGIQPLLCERSVLRLSGERAVKKVAHWQAVAVSACEQSGRTQVPRVAPVATLTDWLRGLPPVAEAGMARWMLGFRDAVPLDALMVPAAGVVCLSGPEGGLSPAEEDAARGAGFVAVSLGPRVLRADTAPLAVLGHLALGHFAPGASARKT